METEQALIYLLAADRLHKPVSSMDGKLQRRKKKALEDVDIEPGKEFQGNRCYARVEVREDSEVARGVKEGIAAFKAKHPDYGTELQELIDEKRKEREVHLVFGLNEGARLTRKDYITVMNSLGYSEAAAQRLYAPLMGVSRALVAKKGDDKRIMVG